MKKLAVVEKRNGRIAIVPLDDAEAEARRGNLEKVRDGNVAKERVVKTEKVSFADIICPVEKSAPHRFNLYVDGGDGKAQLHSTHATRTGAFGKAHSLLENNEYARVAVSDGAHQVDDMKDEDEDEEDRKAKSVEDEVFSGGEKAWRTVTAKPKTKMRDKDEDEDEDEEDRKTKAGLESDDMPPGERRGRGIGAKKRFATSFKNIVFPDSRAGDQHGFHVEDITDARDGDADDMAGPSTGEDIEGRIYDRDDVLARIGGGLSDFWAADDEHVVPTAGSGPTWEGDSRRVPNSGFRPMPGSEGDAHHTGGEDRGSKPARPNLGRSGPYSLEADNIEPEGGAAVPVRIGDGMRIMSPRASGIPGPSKMENFTDDATNSRTLKTAVRKGKHRGTFTDVVFAPLENSNFF